MTSGWNQADSPFHPGEQAAQTRLGIRDKMESVGRRVIRNYLPQQHRDFYTLLPFLIMGTIDAQGRTWASILTGLPGFITSPDAYHLRIAAQPLFGSPLIDQLRVGVDIGILGILPENRRRNRSTGRIVAIDNEGITVKIAQTFGNCPQYIQTREIEVLPQVTQPQEKKAVARGKVLDKQARSLIERSDTLFVATAYGAGDERNVEEDNPAFSADASHRGGKPGFVRVENSQTFILPDFTGNFLFNTIGNIIVNGRAGFLFIDYDTRDTLYLTGQADIVWEGEHLNAFLGADRFIRFHVEAWQRVAASLPIKFKFGEYSPNLQHSGSWRQMDTILNDKRE